MPKPKPVVVTTICSECGLPWDSHGESPTTADCIRLLKAELGKRPTVIRDNWWYPYIYPQPYVRPYVAPYWTTAIQGSSTSPQYTYTTNSTEVRTPAIIQAQCSAVAA